MSDDTAGPNDAQVLAESIVDTIRQPFLILSEDLRVQSANRPFYQAFQVDRAETEGRLIYELGNREWDIPELRHLLSQVLSKNESFEDFEVQHEFPEIGHRVVLLNARRVTQLQLILLAIEDITERRRAEAASRASEERLRQVLETDAVGVLFLDQTGTVVDCNDVFLRMTGRSRREVEARELTWRKMTPPEWIEDSEEQMRKLEATGRIGPYEKEYFLKDGSRSWVLFAGRSLGNGTVVEYCIDIGERKRAEEERELLARELSHRVKNIFAVIQSLAMQTDGRKRSAEEFREVFVGRLQALARAHSLLLDAQWRGTDLKSLAEHATAAYRTDHPEAVEVEGEPLSITPNQALGLSFVLHELGTNAAKYGALSRNEGRLRVSWRVEDGNTRWVRLRWQERHGPVVEAPQEKGFGMQMIERACAYELEGEVELNYSPEGLTCEVVFPLA